MKIDFRVIAHRKQRYDTVGDYWRDDDGTWQIRVSRMSDRRYCDLVFIHELTELLGCIERGVTVEAVDKWDLAYETARDEGPTAPCGCRLKAEPGDDVHAPYHEAHKAAMAAERAAARGMGIDWVTYNREVEGL